MCDPDPARNPLYGDGPALALYTLLSAWGQKRAAERPLPRQGVVLDVGQCAVSQRELAIKLGFTRKVIRRAFDTLVNVGLIDVLSADKHGSIVLVRFTAEYYALDDEDDGKALGKNEGTRRARDGHAKGPRKGPREGPRDERATPSASTDASVDTDDSGPREGPREGHQRAHEGPTLGPMGYMHDMGNMGDTHTPYIPLDAEGDFLEFVDEGVQTIGTGKAREFADGVIAKFEGAIRRHLENDDARSFIREPGWTLLMTKYATWERAVKAFTKESERSTSGARRSLRGSIVGLVAAASGGTVPGIDAM